MTRDDIDIVLSPWTKTTIKMELLNTNYVKIEEIQGDLMSLSLTISATAEIRRVSSASLIVTDSEYLTSTFRSIWLDRMVRIYFGITSNDTITYYLLGSFLMSDNSYQYDISTKELSLSLVDMMAAAREERGNQIGSDGSIPYESTVRTALIAMIAQFSPYKSYNVADFPDVIPYDITFTKEQYPYDVTKTVLDMFPTYEQFYTPDGIYTVQEIPTGIEDEVFLDESVMDKVLISESRNNSFKSVKNLTEIWGMTIDAGYTASSCTTNSGTYEIYIADSFTTLEDNATYSFTTDSDSVSGQKVKIQSTTAYPIYILNGDDTEVELPAGNMKSGYHYVVKYLSNKFYLQGLSTVHAICMEISEERTTEEIAEDKVNYDCLDIKYVLNPDSPFSVDRIGPQKKVLTGGDYDSIYTTELALERAAYENWKTCRLQDSVTLSCRLIPWMDVNKKISYTSPSTGDVTTIMAQEISMDFAACTMSIQGVVFYPYYPW